MAAQCPECGAFLRRVSDPALPPTHANEICPAAACWMDLVNEAVPTAD